MDEKLTILEGINVLGKYIKKHKRNFVLFYIGWFFDSILTVITPIIFAIMIDEMVYYKNIDVFLRVSLTFVIMSIFSCILYFFIYALHHYLMSMYTFDIRLDIFKKMQSLKATYLSNANTGDIINTVLQDTGQCMHFVIRNIIHTTNDILKGIFYITYIYIISIEAGIMVTISLPFAAYSTFKFSKKIRVYTERKRELYGGYVSWLFEILKGITDIRLISAEKIISKDFVKHHRNLFDVSIKASVTNLTSQKIIEFISLLMQLAIYGVCAYLAFNGKITIGNVMVLVAFVFTVKDRIIVMLARNFMDAQERLTGIGRIKRFLSLEDENSWSGDSNLVITQGDVEFKNVSFEYETGKPVLQGLNLFIPSGEHVAIVGKSGCGKTTIASLLIGLFEINSGEILIDGQNIADCSLKSIRKNIGIVQQDVLIFNATIRDNLLLGNSKASEEELWDACRKAGIAEFFSNLPDKLDTMLGNEGMDLSGGQCQRLAIARIYLKSPEIIIFDEATSALDSETEAVIHEAWQELLAGRTAIVIAHRLSSVMLCNKSILIENGRVVATGNPHELMQNNSLFRELFAVKEVPESDL